MKLPRYSLRTMFLAIAICAVIVAWRQSTIHWIDERHQFFQLPVDRPTWAGLTVTHGDWAAELDDQRSGLPWSLWLWGEPMRAKSFQINLKIVKDEQVTTAQIKRLFPEATVTAYKP